MVPPPRRRRVKGFTRYKPKPMKKPMKKPAKKPKWTFKPRPTRRRKGTRPGTILS